MMASFCSITMGTSMTTSTPKASVRMPEKVGTKSSANDGDDGLALIPALTFVLLVVAVVHLDGVADRTRGDQERHHEDERIEREADQVDEPEPPERGDEARKLGRSAPRQSWKYIQRSTHSKH